MTESYEESELEQFNGKLEENHFQGQWKAIQSDGTETELLPHVWKWGAIESALEDAKDVVDLAEQPQGARRSIGLRNPTFSSGNQTSWTINVGVQMVVPDEIARAHRHNITAFRFVIEGDDGAYTNVEGEQFPMESGDLILTPRNTWHDHANYSDEPVIWLDGLDVGLIKALHAEEFENFRDDIQPREKSPGHSSTKYGLLRPTCEEVSEFEAPPYRYSWEETRNTLLSAADSDVERDPYNGVKLEYANPETGSEPTLNTLSLSAQLCPEGETTETHRHNSTEVYHVVQGSGHTTIDSERFEWSAGDCFVVPPGSWHAHHADEKETILFGVSDRPVFESFGIHHEKSKAANSATETEGSTGTVVSEEG